VGFEPVENFECSECFAQKLWLNRTFAAGLYSGVLRDAIHLLKYRRKRFIARPLGRLLRGCLAGEMDIDSYDLLVPVPLHRNRLKERGYNQSELIADSLCDEPFRINRQSLLKRVKDTPSFSRLGARERRKQIRNAFLLIPENNVKGSRILLIDDVVTTMATTNECARILRKAGAACVDVIAVAVARRLE
jgi:ComF family protein